VFFFNFFVLNIDGVCHCFKEAKGVRQVKKFENHCPKSLQFKWGLLIEIYLKNVEKFSETMQKILPENSLLLPRNRQKIEMTSFVMTSMAMLTQS